VLRSPKYFFRLRLSGAVNPNNGSSLISVTLSDQPTFIVHRQRRLLYILGIYEPGKAVESGLQFRRRRETARGAGSGDGAGASGGLLEGEQATKWEYKRNSAPDKVFLALSALLDKS
jgi:hypothetical protein